MCDIWKGNRNLKQLTEVDVEGLMVSLKKFRTVQVVMSGGEAILHQNFFELCRILKRQNIKITLLTSGHAIKRHAEMLVKHVDDLIISLDGSEAIHNSIRNIENAYAKTKESIQAIKAIKPDYKISGRTVIHKLNYRIWPDIVKSAKEIGLNSISFLPADITSTAFNHTTGWDEKLQDELLIDVENLEELKNITEQLIADNATDFRSRYIVESPEKIRKILAYYGAHSGLNEFPYKRCNAPWVSTVIEADGSVKPCFFHESIGNIKDGALHDLVNKDKALRFRKELDMDENPICKRCVCSLYLPVTVNPAAHS